MILLDTNVISELMRTEPEPAVLGWLDQQLESELYLCAVTKAEIELGIAQLPEGKQVARMKPAQNEPAALNRTTRAESGDARDFPMNCAR